MSMLVRAARSVRPVRPVTAEPLERRVLLSTSVTSYHNDNASTGGNLTETLLTPGSVKVGTFGKQFATPVDGQVYAQPLYVPGVNITGGRFAGTHDVTYVATEHDSLYAIDAHGGNILWQVSFLDPATSGAALTGATSITSVPNADVNSGDIQPEIGITSTPVIDPAQHALFVLTKTKQVVAGQTHYVAGLFKIDIQSGAVLTSTVIADTIYQGGNYTYRTNATATAAQDPFTVGTGDGVITVGGQSRVYFNALREMSRPGVVLYNGRIYTAWASHGDNGPYHGWVLGFDENTLATTAAFNTTPNGGLGGIWQGGDITPVDSAGNFYFETGNGTFDGDKNSSGQTTGLDANGFPAKGDYSDSFLKVSLDPATGPGNQNINGWGMKVADYFTPFNNHALDSVDRDLGSGGPLLLPDAVGNATHPHLFVGAGKEGKIYLIDRDNMGKFDPNTDHVVQEQASTLSGVLNAPALFYDGTTYRIYFLPGYNNDKAKSYTIANGTFSTAPTSQSPDTYGYLPGSPSISANGTSNGILWAIDTGSSTVRAYDAKNLATELWTSAQGTGNGLLGTAIKFSVPTIADGEVFVGTSSALVAYGPPVVPTAGPAAPTNLTAVSPNYQTVNLAWQDNASNEDYYTILRSTDNVTFTAIGQASANAQSYADTTNLLAQTTYYYKVVAHNGFAGGTDSAPSNTATVTTPTPPPLGTGDGASATYFNDTNGNHLVSPAALTRVDPQIKTDWGNGSPGTGIGVDNFSARWTGRIQAQFSETYTFYTNSDDGVRFYIKPVASGTYTTLINDFTDHGPTEDSGTITLSAGQYYDFKMEYYEAGGGAVAQLSWSSTSTPKAFVPQSQLYSGVAPVIPTNLAAAAASGTQLNLTWTDNSANEAGFLLQRTNPDNTVTNITLPPNTTSYMDTGLTPDTQYVYRLQATNFAASSAFTAPVTVTTPIAPPTPSNAQTTTVTTTSISFTWQRNSTKPSDTETGVAISRKAGSAGFFSVIADLALGTTSFTNAGLTPGTDYDFHVQEHNAAGYSDFTGVHTQTLTLAPTGLAATPSGGQIALTWTAPVVGTGVTPTYNVYRGTAANGEGATPYATGVTSASFADAAVTAGTTYYYQVAAVDLGGESARSGEASATAPVTPVLAAPVVNDGSSQRSKVTGVTLSFSEAVTLAPGAVTIALDPAGNGGVPVGTVPTIGYATTDGGLTYTVTFSGAGVVNGSVADGVYLLTVHAALVTDAGNAQLSGGDRTVGFHRLFGDVDGNRSVNTLDFNKFKATLGRQVGDPAYVASLDYDGGGSVNTIDFNQFKTRLGTSFA
jgi:fibronectin type 3 domain-containing protein